MITRPCGHAASDAPRCRWCLRLDDTGPDGVYYRALAEALAAGVPAAPAARLRRPCRHAGPETGMTRGCPSCKGTVRVKLLGCALHGVRTALKPLPGVACCASCPDHDPTEPFAGPPVRDLAYHLYPLRAGGHVWRWNVRQLIRRIGLFNGRRVVALSVDDRTEPPGEVLDAFGGEIDPGDVLVLPNEPAAPEAHTLVPLLGRLTADDPDRVLLRAHAKGVTRAASPDAPLIREWTETLYEVMLDYWPAVEADLERFAVTGCFRCLWQQWPREAPGCGWFYSGSWAWFRSRHLFGRPWRTLPRFWATAEALPALLFARDEAGCLFADSCGVAYSPAAWKYLRPAFDRWAALNSHRRTAFLENRQGDKETRRQGDGPLSLSPCLLVSLSPVHVVTCITESYLPRARPFLASLALLRSSRRWCVCLGFDPGPLITQYPWVIFRAMPRHASESHGMLQTGRWLDVIPEASGVVVLSDADVIVQRDWTHAERQALDDLDDATFLAAPNAPGDALADEAARIGLADAPRDLGGMGGVSCYNCGVLAARPAAWRRLRDRYEADCAAFYARTAHRSRCQLLVNVSVRRAGCAFVPLPPAVHQHHHFGMPAGVTFRGGAACHGDALVLFRHAFPDS